MNYGGEDHLQRHKQPNILDGKVVEEGDEMIANEFSDDEIDDEEDMEEFMEYEEEIEARQSISSRGSQAIPSKNKPGNLRGKPEQRETEYRPNEQKHQNDNLHDYNQGVEEEENFGEGESSSVITEIVDEQVVEIDTDFEEEKIEEKNPENEGQYDEYLDNINQDDYVNRDEYQEFEDNKGASPYPKNEEQEHQEYGEDPQEYEQENENQEYDQEYAQDQNYQQMVDNKYMMENSPIAENPVEEELTGSPQYYEAPRAVNPKYRKKYQGYNLNDKSHLIWEQERLERKRMEREMRRNNLWTQEYNFRDIDWHPNMNPKRAAFQVDKKPNKSNLWHFSNSSSVPMLTTAKSIKSKAAGKNELVKHDPKEATAKKDHKINNIFHQSSYQNILSGKNGQISTPSSHVSLKKETGRGFMTPIDNKYVNQNTVLAGRQRMFHSSQIF